MPGSTSFPTSLDSHTSASPLGFGEVTNQANTLTTAAHTNSVTTITVASTSAFPPKGYIVIKREIISYTGTTATTFTGCTRGVGGTTAAAYLSGTKVEHVVVAANHNDLAAAIVAIETVLGAGITATNGVMRKIAEVAGANSSGVLEFSSIPATYRGLLVSFVGRTSNAAAQHVRLTFETSPTAGAYDHQYLDAAGAAASPAENIGAADYIQVSSVPGSGAAAGLVGSGIIEIPEYANTSILKTVVARGVGALDLSSSLIYLKSSVGVWESTAAISRIRLILSAGNWTTLSRATLYGLPA